MTMNLQEEYDDLISGWSHFTDAHKVFFDYLNAMLTEEQKEKLINKARLTVLELSFPNQ